MHIQTLNRAADGSYRGFAFVKGHQVNFTYAPGQWANDPLDTYMPDHVTPVDLPSHLSRKLAGTVRAQVIEDQRKAENVYPAMAAIGNQIIDIITA